jgi:hypothetical protein
MQHELSCIASEKNTRTEMLFIFIIFLFEPKLFDVAGNMQQVPFVAGFLQHVLNFLCPVGSVHRTKLPRRLVVF